MKRPQLQPSERYAFIITPPHGAKSWALYISKKQLKLMLAMLVCLLIFSSGASYFYSQSNRKIRDYTVIKKKLARQEKENKAFKSTLYDLQTTIESMIYKETQIQYLLKDSRYKLPRYQQRRLRKQAKKKISRYQKKRHTFERRHSLSLQLDHTAQTVQSLYASIDSHYQLTLYMRDQFASTPSIWPAYGGVLSGFGMRMHPIKRIRRLHAGIDIPSWIGAPVKATADGVVLYAGWRGTFGNFIMVRHSLGFSTRYAHLSRVLVQRGARVQKGQVIGQLGQSGLSTGPHLHYEVHRWNRPINPARYLDLDLFTASTQIW